MGATKALLGAFADGQTLDYAVKRARLRIGEVDMINYFGDKDSEEASERAIPPAVPLLNLQKVIEVFINSGGAWSYVSITENVTITHPERRFNDQKMQIDVDMINYFGDDSEEASERAVVGEG